ncbi:MAG: FecR domain-containing protein [Butyrivibrio sp.]|nr:FecR domain-containing protein [Butyrivibrio sp.]
MDKEKGKSGIVKWIIIALIVIAAIVAGILIFLNGQKLSATTMRLLKIQGIVKLFDKDKEKTITDNLRLSNGNILSTESESLASIALDETKIVTINDNSRAEFQQDGKKLNINLTAGSLFFNVTQKLAADESFDIRTSNMVVGIRGTSGLVCVDEEGHEVLYVTDGEVEVVGTNNVTGEQKTITVKAGEKITIYLYNDKEKDSIMFELTPVADVDLIDAIRDRLIEDEALLDRVCAATGWDKEVILGISYGSSDSGSDASGGETSTTEQGTSEGGESDTTGEESSGTEGGTTQEQTTDDTGTEESEGGEAEGASDNSQTKAPSLLETEVKGVDEENGNLILNDDSEFNPDYYYASNEDVASAIGNDPEALLEHYLTFGQDEGRVGTSQDAKAAEQQKQQEAKEKQQQYEDWQETLERAEQEAAEKAAQEEQDAVTPERLAQEQQQQQQSSSSSSDSGSSNRSGYYQENGQWYYNGEPLSENDINPDTGLPYGLEEGGTGGP